MSLRLTPQSMKSTDLKHASACHPERSERSEGSLPSAAEEARRGAPGDGYSRHLIFRAVFHEAALRPNRMKMGERADKRF